MRADWSVGHLVDASTAQLVKKSSDGRGECLLLDGQKGSEESFFYIFATDPAR